MMKMGKIKMMKSRSIQIFIHLKISRKKPQNVYHFWENRTFIEFYSDLFVAVIN